MPGRDICSECGLDCWGFDRNGKGFCINCRDRGFDNRRLRDEFAMAALTGRLANHRLTGPEDYNDNLLKDCYSVADKMIALREGK